MDSGQGFFRRHDWVFRYVPFFFWLGLIFFNSSSQASASETSRFITPILELLFPDASENTLALYHSYVRKLAHFLEYGALAFFTVRVFWESKVASLKARWAIISIVVVAVVGGLDELIQSFNPTRTGSISDVLLDCIGGVVVVSVLATYKRVRNN